MSSERKCHRPNYYTIAISCLLAAALIICHFHSGFDQGEERNGYHEEYIPSSGISYLENGEPRLLPDGCYALAVPSGEDQLPSKDETVFPLFLILIPQADSFRLFPINLTDHVILPRDSRRLVLHNLLVFHSLHAENILRYDEKGTRGHVASSPDDDYARKAFYYLLVRNGYGEIQRGYMSEENAGSALRWYRDTDTVDKELLTIHFIIHDCPPGEIEDRVMHSSIQSDF